MTVSFVVSAFHGKAPAVDSTMLFFENNVIVRRQVDENSARRFRADAVRVDGQSRKYDMARRSDGKG